MRTDGCLTETLILIYHNEHQWSILQMDRWKLNAQSEANRSICSGQRRGPLVNKWYYIETGTMQLVRHSSCPMCRPELPWAGAIVVLSLVGVFIYLIVGTVILVLCPSASPCQTPLARASLESTTQWHHLFLPLPPRSSATTHLSLSS